VREPFICARGQGIIGFSCCEVRRGIHWRSFPECHPMEGGRISTAWMNQALNAVLTKA
jgi:hypothetical protein